jgi:hypothetical protein
MTEVVTNLMCNVFTAWYGTELDLLLSVYVDAIFHTSSKRYITFVYLKCSSCIGHVFATFYSYLWIV